MATNTHQNLASGRIARTGVLTVSDTRTASNDTSGRIICRLLLRAGHEVREQAIVRDEPDAIGAYLDRWIAREDMDLILLTGGTGLARRDTTIEVVAARFDRELDGFGELFRMLSWKQIGPAAMMSRATAGLAGRTLLFAMPGSSAAVRLAMTELIVPEIAHLLWVVQDG